TLRGGNSSIFTFEMTQEAKLEAFSLGPVPPQPSESGISVRSKHEETQRLANEHIPHESVDQLPTERPAPIGSDQTKYQMRRILQGACLIVPLFNKFGFGKTIVVGAVTHMMASGLQSARPPFPDAGASAYVANIKDNAETKMGLLHAAYGAGALCAPLVATQFAQLERWSFHFLCTLGIGFIASNALSFTFRFKSQEAPRAWV
ncbi:hypothetical protein MPER_09710, partial [Moniliophthora perniciosa FA553]